MDNFNNSEPIHVAAIAVNSVSFIIFLFMYASEIYRENWCITYLDINPKKPIEHLDTEIENYPALKIDMARLNDRYRKLVILCIGFQFVNVSVSSIDIMKYGSGSASIAPMMSYIVLIVTKLASTYNIASASLSKERAYSAYLSGPKTYNVIDMDHKHPANKDIESITVEDIVDEDKVNEDIVEEDIVDEDKVNEDIVDSEDIVLDKVIS
jgi:hypothetical protein